MEYQVTLTEMLDARERRLAWQKRLLTKYRIPMVCFTMNIAGPIKKSPLIQRGFELGKRYLKEQLDLEFIEKNLSPGGSADLLAVCYLLYFLETEV